MVTTGHLEQPNTYIDSVTIREGLPTEVGVEVHVNEDNDEHINSLIEPVIFENTTDYTDEQLLEGMRTEAKSISDFGVKKDIPITELSDDEVRTALDMRWVYTWKGSFVRARPLGTRPWHYGSLWTA